MITPGASVYIELAATDLGARLAYVLGVLCERYGWQWGSARAGASSRTRRPPGVRAVRLSYGPPSRGAAIAEDAPAPDDGGGISLRTHGLLAAPAGSTACDVAWDNFDGIPCPTGADPLAGAFFCLALLGEYVDRPTDRHGRLPSSTHVLHRRGLARVPIADRLLAAVAQRLWRAAGFAGTPPPLPEASAATSDIDAPRAVAHKPLPRRLSALARGFASVIKAGGPMREVSPGRALDYWRGRDDPFDTFAYMHASACARGLREDAFTLVGYGTALDPGWPRGHEAWPRFWRKRPPGLRLGIHPSYHASDRPELLAEEIALLRTALDAPVVASRQHFLRLRIPDTFRALIECGIREDHTLMWADRDGFRAGTARSFRWYDLRREETTNLRLFPPHAMDVTARYYGGLSPKQAVASWTELAAEARRSGTALRCIWHNSNLGPWYGWLPWRAAYEASLDLSVIR